MSRSEQPMQPIAFDKGGVIRFRENKLVNFLLDEAREGRKCDLNRLALITQERAFPHDDVEQFWQMLGYSVSAYGGLSFVRKKTRAKADAIAEELIAARRSKPRRKHSGFSQVHCPICAPCRCVRAK